MKAIRVNPGIVRPSLCGDHTDVAHVERFHKEQALKARGAVGSAMPIRAGSRA